MRTLSDHGVRLINCNKCTTLVRDITNEGSCTCRESGSIWEISVPSSSILLWSKNSLKKKSILKTQENSKERVSGGYADLYTPEPKKDLQSSSVLQIRYCQIAKLKLVMDRTVFYFCMYPVHLFNTKK